jgi:hypothetical protein
MTAPPTADPHRAWADVANYWYNASLYHKQAHAALYTHVYGQPCAEPSSKRLRTSPQEEQRILESIDSFADIVRHEGTYAGASLPQLQDLRRIAQVAREIDALVGLEDVKSSLFRMVVYHLRASRRTVKTGAGMMNMCITGDPGTGKTTLVGLIARLFAASGLLAKGQVVVAGRQDFVGKFIGHTAPQTTAVLRRALGGVLVIDEAYTMGTKGHDDSFSREAMDTINEFLSVHAGDIMIIVAGYHGEMQGRFFSQNPGLERRFPVRFNLGRPNAAQLCRIFDGMVKTHGWSLLDTGAIHAIIRRRHHTTPCSAGDMATLVLHSEFEAAVRCWKQQSTENVLTVQDVEDGVSRMDKREPDTGFGSMYT